MVQSYQQKFYKMFKTNFIQYHLMCNFALKVTLIKIKYNLFFKCLPYYYNKKVINCNQFCCFNIVYTVIDIKGEVWNGV